LPAGKNPAGRCSGKGTISPVITDPANSLMRAEKCFPGRKPNFFKHDFDNFLL
jgi:hypothetical protein